MINWIKNFNRRRRLNKARRLYKQYIANMPDDVDMTDEEIQEEVDAVRKEIFLENSLKKKNER